MFAPLRPSNASCPLDIDGMSEMMTLMMMLLLLLLRQQPQKVASLPACGPNCIIYLSSRIDQQAKLHTYVHAQAEPHGDHIHPLRVDAAGQANA